MPPSCQVRAAHVAKEHSIPSEDADFLAVLVVEDVAGTLGGVTRGMHTLGLDGAHLELLSVLELGDIKLVGLSLGAGAHDDGHSEGGVPRQEVRVEVGQHDVLQMRPPLGNDVLVHLDVEGGVDDEGRLVLSLHVVGEDCQVRGLELRDVEPVALLLGGEKTHQENYLTIIRYACSSNFLMDSTLQNHYFKILFRNLKSLLTNSKK